MTNAVPVLFFKNCLTGRNQYPFLNGVAFVSNGAAWVSGINYGGFVTPAPVQNPSLASLKEWVKSCFGDSEPLQSDYRPGTAYKRIALPLASGGTLDRVIDHGVLNQSFVALKLVLSKMQEMFETIEPSSQNLNAYGHRVRELLILACMEVEASWAAVLKANGYGIERPTTDDYVKLLDPMILDSYSLELSSYHEYPVIAPFDGWQPKRATRTLDWYHAYNQTKHNREECLSVATFKNAVDAVGAAVIMMYAQFGMSIESDVSQPPVIRNVFRLQFDSSKHPTSYYVPIMDPSVSTTTPSWQWKLLDYPFPKLPDRKAKRDRKSM